MAAVEIKYATAETTGGVTKVSHKGNWLIASAGDLAGIIAPAAGSTAFKADGSLIYMFDGTEWVQWGGSDNE